MTPQEFKNIWNSTGDKLSPLTESRVVGLNLKPSTIEFLVTSGLPVDAAPFLTFADDSSDKYKGIVRLTDQYDFLEDEFNKWIVIGSCSDGDPLQLTLRITTKLIGWTTTIILNHVFSTVQLKRQQTV